MRTASLVLGLVGGVLGIVAGFLALAVGGIGHVAGQGNEVVWLGIAAIFLSVVAMIGGALALRYPRAAALLQLISGLAGFIAISWFWFFSGPLLLVGALLAWLGRDRHGRPALASAGDGEPALGEGERT